MAKKEDMWMMLAFWLVIIGALNWLLVAFGFNLVTWLLGSWDWLVKVVYGAVGASAVYVVYGKYMMRK